MLNIFTIMEAQAASVLTGKWLSEDSIQAVGDGVWGLHTDGDAYGFFLGLINIALTLVAVVAFTYLVFLGVKVLTGAADLEEVKKSIATTFVGLLIIISSYSFVNTILEKVPQSETLTETSSNSDF